MNYVTHPLRSADISIFHRKSANVAISRNTDVDCILLYNFHCFNKHGYHFDDFSKNDYSRPS